MNFMNIFLLLTLFNVTAVNPPTGDTTDLTWLIPVSIAALVLAIILIIVGKKRKNNFKD